MKTYKQMVNVQFSYEELVLTHHILSQAHVMPKLEERMKNCIEMIEMYMRSASGSADNEGAVK